MLSPSNRVQGLPGGDSLRYRVFGGRFWGKTRRIQPRK